MEDLEMEISNREDKDCKDASNQTTTRTNVDSNTNDKELDIIQ